MNETAVWGSVLGVAAISIVAALTVVRISQNDTMTAMVKNGANPIAAMCAVHGVTNSNSAACIASIAKEK